MNILSNLGLTKYESLVYEALLKRGRSNAEQIAESCEVPKTAIYPSVRSLIKKGLVHEIKGKPMLFETLPPKSAIQSLIKRKSEELNALNEEAISYAEGLKKNIIDEERKEIVWLSHGKEASRDFYFASFARAKKNIFILGWRFEKVDDKYEVLKHLKPLIKKKIDIRIILTGKPDKKKQLIRDYEEEGIKIRYLPIDNFSIFVCDGKECKITLKDREKDQRFNMNILDNSLAKALHDYFLECWDKARKI